MEKSIFAYIWRHSLRQQFVLTLLAATSFPFLYLFYELPKLIINDAIEGRKGAFPRELYDTLTLSQVQYLLLLCSAFLGLVIVNQAFKYVINVYRGLTGERMLRRLRYDLYSRILRFPLPTFRKMSPGEIIPMITSEVEPLGGFIGDAFSVPAFQGGTLLTILGFLFYQDWRMALAAVVLYPLQIWLIPQLQRRVNRLGKERVRRVRRLSDRVGESIQGVQEIHAHDMSNYALADFSRHLDGIFYVRYQIYQKKFVIKFLNNFIQQLGPFFFYSIGGYLVIMGELQIGTLVAAIAAQKDLAAPWRELLTYYQQQADASIKYEAVVTQFEPPGMRPADYQVGEPEGIGPLGGEIVTANLTLMDDQNAPVIDGLSLRLSLDKRYAVIGSSGSGKEELALLLARLVDPQSGSISIAGRDAASLHEAVTGRRMAYVGPTPHVFSGTIADNLYFGLKHRPLREPNYDEQALHERRRYVLEAERAGNIGFDVDADWLDYGAAGVDGPDALRLRAIEVLAMVGMDE
ncbi:MAG TPA: ABC transporter ATP-binding protein, partial [Alphaproteobacteria bacterium]|nr:ABC transporter ATP-binding protein [Alphaproteobacteria bacterium]